MARTLLEERLVRRTYSAGATILERGSICQAMYFLNHGSVIHGEESDDETVILNLFTDNQWFMNYRGFIAQKPDESFLRAFETSDVFVLDIRLIHELIDSEPRFVRLGKLMEESISIPNQIHGSMTPEERYRHLLQHHPEYVLRFPLKWIASFLGMAPETLSRIRSRLASEKPG